MSIVAKRSPISATAELLCELLGDHSKQFLIGEKQTQFHALRTCLDEAANAEDDL